MRVRSRLRFSALLLAASVPLLSTGVGAAQEGPPDAANRGRSAEAPGRSFDLVETSIAEVHRAFQRRQLTCEELVEGYLDRIEAYEDSGPAINAIIAVNPGALETARELDAAYSQGGGLTGPLHCVPMLIKDNLDTVDMPTTGGAKALEFSQPTVDSFVVSQLREAGAIVLAKSNLDELARGASGSSSFGGQTLNPYDLGRIPGGSSAGTGAGVAANFALAGIGTETGVSIRNPSTNNNLVGIAPTRGLVSQSGIIPISFTQDRAGPLAKSVDDAARILDVIAGFDPRDTQTSLSVGRMPDTYIPSGDDGPMRVGVVRELFGTEPGEAESGAIIDEAIAELEAAGVTVVQDVPIQTALDAALPVLDPLYPNEDRSITRVLSDARTNNYEYRDAFNAYLDALGDAAPYEDLAEMLAENPVDGDGFLPNVRRGLVGSQEGLGLLDPEYTERLLRINALQRATLEVMAELDLDGLVFPMKTVTAPQIGGSAPASTIAASGNVLSSITGFPSVITPAGFAADGLPVGLEILGRPFTEDVILEIAATYEGATDHRRLPESTPALD